MGIGSHGTQYGVPRSYLDLIDPLANNVKVQLPASSYNPVGLVGEMSLEPHGISMALEAKNSIVSVMAVNVAAHQRADLTKPTAFIVGWSGISGSGNVNWQLDYSFLGVDDDTSSTTPNDTVLKSDTVTVANGYKFSVFEMTAPGVNSRICKLRLFRDGLGDTNAGDVYIEGSLLSFGSIGEIP